MGLILNMLIMGVWHGLEGHYILYGLYHGILLAVVEVYQKKSKFYKNIGTINAMWFARGLSILTLLCWDF